jgi:tungstate transport system substrate-binding protein
MTRWPQFLKAPIIALLVTATALLCSQAYAQEKSIVVASTTSTQDAGLFGYLLPIVKEKTGIVVKVLAQGTGQALDTARRGDADVVFSAWIAAQSIRPCRAFLSGGDHGGHPMDHQGT